MYKNLFKSFVKKVENSNNTWMIPQQRKAQSFHIKVVTKKKVLGFEVEHRVMPIDTFFPIELFDFVIDELFNSPTKSLERGNGLENPIGGVGMGINTIESKVAIRFYAKRRGQFVDRRISVIANILVESGVCAHGRGILRLKNLNRNFKNGSTPVGIDNPKNTPKKPIGTNDKDLPEYLIKNKNKILTAPHQNINLITSKYSNEMFLDFEVMRKFFKTFPNLKNKSIQRKDVSELFRKKQYYLGFITAMIWGGINASRPKKKDDFETIDFYRLLTQDEKKITIIIHHVKSLLVKEENFNCFNYLYKEGKINGVGHAYFTKLMYFIGYVDKRIKLKPLIFDKWTSNAYLALLINSNQFDKVSKFYSGKIDNKNQSVSLRSNIALTYENYIKDMNCWALKLGVSASRLEEFVFGVSLKENKKFDNPRKELWRIIDKYTNK